MIPKILHYVWMGGKKKPEEVQNYIATWQKHLPDYQIIEWNESNFDIKSNLYANQAYEAKKWAFVSDYVRLAVLQAHGGIYLDTDMEVLKPLEPFLHHRAFVGFEGELQLQTGLLAAEKNHPWIEALLADYEDRQFLNPDGSLDTTVNVVRVTRITKEKFGLVPSGEKQVLKDDLHVYPKEYFCPLDYIPFRYKKSPITNNTYTVHHYAGSWESGSARLRAKALGFLGEGFTYRLRRMRDRIKGE